MYAPRPRAFDGEYPSIVFYLSEPDGTTTRFAESATVVDSSSKNNERQVVKGWDSGLGDALEGWRRDE